MIVLASQSPRRRELLERAGIAFTVRVADIDESVQPGEAPQQYVRRLAARKAKNFKEADRIRDELAGLGVQLKDAKDPATGEIVTTWEMRR